VKKALIITTMLTILIGVFVSFKIATGQRESFGIGSEWIVLVAGIAYAGHIGRRLVHEMAVK
jgi:hypothetical protein